MVWALPRSLATTGGIIIYFLFLEVLRCFSSLRLLSAFWQSGSHTAVGLSHSEICGSKIICIYPQLIAAYHVLHRLCEPRHPPCALHYFCRLAPVRKGRSRAHTSAVFCCHAALLISPCRCRGKARRLHLQSCLCHHFKDLLAGRHACKRYRGISGE